MAHKTGLTSQVVEIAKNLGATLAGIASVEQLKASPSFLVAPTMDPATGIGMWKSDLTREEVVWPEGFNSVVVVALKHSEKHPDLDWWDNWWENTNGGTPGNRIMMSITAGLSTWIREELHLNTAKLPYYIEDGGTFLKDAAVMAGLGSIGKNNILVTPDYGPRVRLYALLVDEELEATGPIGFDLCRSCSMPCRAACPQDAFGEVVFTEERTITSCLPGRDGRFNRVACSVQMRIDLDKPEEVPVAEGNPSTRLYIKFCRRCEMACPVGEGI
ncbi:MAG TPA: epoxyqueuosine reductase [Anaerolineae bacterium]|nr:epoxyqueuosine reductase [Anaerolineae bacterium]